MEFEHKSVLLKECIEGLCIKPHGVYIDGTMGGAGHSLEICKALEAGRFIGVDQDENAIAKSAQVLKAFPGATLVKNNFANMKEVLSGLKVREADGFLLDLGVSSHQLDAPERGFSYMQDAPLDMRMSLDADLTAYNVINQYKEQSLTRIISDYGEERWAKRIAGFIVAEREKKPIATTLELVSVIKKAVPKAARSDGPHPAKRTFQAIRIEVNGELEILRTAIEDMAGLLAPGGRLCIITFHSLEDRIVKNAFRDLENPCTCPPDFPVCACGKTPLLKVITRKPILPSEDELNENHRARSAKLRIAERL